MKYNVKNIECGFVKLEENKALNKADFLHDENKLDENVDAKGSIKDLEGINFSETNSSKKFSKNNFDEKLYANGNEGQLEEFNFSKIDDKNLENNFDDNANSKRSIERNFRIKNDTKKNLKDNFGDKSNNIKSEECEEVLNNPLNKKSSKTNFSCKKKQVMFSWLFICLVFFNLCGLTLSSTNLSTYVKRIVASFSPNTESIGKIKFVTNDYTEEDFLEVISMLDFSYQMPFKTGVATQNEDGKIFITSSNDIMVLCCYDSTVCDIQVENNKKTVTFDCGFKVKVKYIGLDNVGVKVGNKLKKGDVVGTSLASIIEIQVLYKDKPFNKIKVKDGKLSIF